MFWIFPPSQISSKMWEYRNRTKMERKEWRMLLETADFMKYASIPCIILLIIQADMFHRSPGSFWKSLPFGSIGTVSSMAGDRVEPTRALAGESAKLMTPPRTPRRGSGRLLRLEMVPCCKSCTHADSWSCKNPQTKPKRQSFHVLHIKVFLPNFPLLHVIAGDG